MRTALVAVVLLVLQSVLVGFTLGASAAAPALDTFGNPICLTGSEGSSRADQPSPGHSRLPDCCTIGCPMLSGPLVGPAPEAVALPAPLGVVTDAGRPVAANTLPPDRRGRPGSQRAPPLGI